VRNQQVKLSLINWHVELYKCATNISHMRWHFNVKSLVLDLLWNIREIYKMTANQLIENECHLTRIVMIKQVFCFVKYFFFSSNYYHILSLRVFWSLNVKIVYFSRFADSPTQIFVAQKAKIKCLRFHFFFVYANDDERNVSHLHLSNLVIHSSFSSLLNIFWNEN
jgi:hypothetical protein